MWQHHNSLWECAGVPGLLQFRKASLLEVTAIGSKMPLVLGLTSSEDNLHDATHQGLGEYFPEVGRSGSFRRVYVVSQVLMLYQPKSIPRVIPTAPMATGRSARSFLSADTFFEVQSPVHGIAFYQRHLLACAVR